MGNFSGEGTAWRNLKEAGYLIALDDYVAGDRREPLADLADIIKVEMKLTAEPQRAALLKRFGPLRCRRLAEKVEDACRLHPSPRTGLRLFSGTFFRRPEMLSTRDMPANRLNYLRILQEVSRPDLDLPGLERLIRSEASVCYRLLRYLNSAVFGFRSEIHFVRHALSIRGERDLQRWVRLIAAVGAGQERTSELGLSALVRGRFGELLVPHALLGQPSALPPNLPVDARPRERRMGSAARLCTSLQLNSRMSRVSTGRRRSGLASSRWNRSVFLGKILALRTRPVLHQTPFLESIRHGLLCKSG